MLSGDDYTGCGGRGDAMITPGELQDITPVQWDQQQAVQSIILDTLRAHGYQPVSTPLLEYASMIVNAMPNARNRSLVQLVDRDHIMVLRPDHTVPIARLVGMHMRNKTGPIRLCYVGPIYYRDDAGACVEQSQIGVELIGESPDADADVLLILTQVLDALQLSDWLIDVGHVDTMASGLDYRYSGIPARGAAALTDAPEALQSVIQACNHPKIVPNRAVVNDVTYYTGIVFEAMVPTWGGVIATGGRYDGLLAQFGPDRPAVGFCLNMNAIMAVLP
ncbi:MAG: ATP phosphoribosyltransferase regulatory subunit [bacterium]|nr:ATP phosphoribosyltransferase regulatory subunit [bacterium]